MTIRAAQMDSDGSERFKFEIFEILNVKNFVSRPSNSSKFGKVFGQRPNFRSNINHDVRSDWLSPKECLFDK